MTTNRSFRGMMGGNTGGMMNGTVQTDTTGPGPVEWTVLVLSVAFLGLAAFLFVRGRTKSSPHAGPAMPPAPMAVSALSPASGISATAPAIASMPGATSPAPTEPVPEPALMKLLDQDERTMYLEIRDHGGVMLQRDLVALGIFSKAKVTRVLDKLEAKDLVVREAHGMTNRVRIVNRAK